MDQDQGALDAVFLLFLKRIGYDWPIAAMYLDLIKMSPEQRRAEISEERVDVLEQEIEPAFQRWKDQEDQLSVPIEIVPNPVWALGFPFPALQCPANVFELSLTLKEAAQKFAEVPGIVFSARDLFFFYAMGFRMHATSSDVLEATKGTFKLDTLTLTWTFSVTVSLKRLRDAEPLKSEGKWVTVSKWTGGRPPGEGSKRKGEEEEGGREITAFMRWDMSQSTPAHVFFGEVVEVAANFFGKTIIKTKEGKDASWTESATSRDFKITLSKIDYALSPAIEASMHQAFVRQVRREIQSLDPWPNEMDPTPPNNFTRTDSPQYGAFINVPFPVNGFDQPLVGKKGDSALTTLVQFLVAPRGNSRWTIPAEKIVFYDKSGTFAGAFSNPQKASYRLVYKPLEKETDGAPPFVTDMGALTIFYVSVAYCSQIIRKGLEAKAAQDEEDFEKGERVVSRSRSKAMQQQESTVPGAKSFVTREPLDPNFIIFSTLSQERQLKFEKDGRDGLFSMRIASFSPLHQEIWLRSPALREIQKATLLRLQNEFADSSLLSLLARRALEQFFIATEVGSIPQLNFTQSGRTNISFFGCIVSARAISELRNKLTVLNLGKSKQKTNATAEEFGIVQDLLTNGWAFSPSDEALMNQIYLSSANLMRNRVSSEPFTWNQGEEFDILRPLISDRTWEDGVRGKFVSQCQSLGETSLLEIAQIAAVLGMKRELYFLSLEKFTPEGGITILSTGGRTRQTDTIMGIKRKITTEEKNPWRKYAQLAAFEAQDLKNEAAAPPRSISFTGLFAQMQEFIDGFEEIEEDRLWLEFGAFISWYIRKITVGKKREEHQLPVMVEESVEPEVHIPGTEWTAKTLTRPSTQLPPQSIESMTDQLNQATSTLFVSMANLWREPYAQSFCL